MDMSVFMQMISSVGFPICCCVYLIYMNNQSDERHAQEIEKLRETVENNTKVMIELSAKLGVMNDKGN